MKEEIIMRLQQINDELQSLFKKRESQTDLEFDRLEKITLLTKEQRTLIQAYLEKEEKARIKKVNAEGDRAS